MNLGKMTEAEVRALRDRVYGQPISDKEWAHCREKWMTTENMRWLREKAERPIVLP